MMAVIGDLLPLALGVAVTPLAVMVVILLLVAPDGRRGATAFVAGWFVGLAAVGVAVLLLADVALGASGDGAGKLATLLKLALGGCLVVLAVREWRDRPRAGQVAELPGWMNALESATPARALALGVTLAAVKPKNLLLTASAATRIAEAGLGPGPSAALLGGFIVMASASVAAPLVLAAARGPAAPAMLDAWKAWLEANNSVLVALVMLVFGVVLVGRGISGLG